LTSHIKTLEWLVKLPTMSLTFKSVLEHVELVQLFLKFSDLDPSAYDNCAIRWASENGHTGVVNLLKSEMHWFNSFNTHTETLRCC